ncbi:SEC-C metal-binding domain-containing protein [Anaerovorax odorimutans]|uniref:SEC-C metal-binding domain-containing protein n=1 Tax=Anaerovorax odorimutans TaxID=109327 RepID=UPI000414A074|nr:SEC-C metal-binding domain-containing protein [Anaerovorax odorimutans]
MSLYQQWQELIDNQTDETFGEFWEKYSSTEKRIYSSILEKPKTNVKGTFKELAEKYEADPIIFMGFLDGINTSLKNSQDFQSFDDNSEVILDIDYEKLFFNMLDAKADYLYTLPQWEDILSKEKREEIIKNYKKSKTVKKEKEPGRNDPCPCGSGKKYKKCCGTNK